MQRYKNLYISGQRQTAWDELCRIDIRHLAKIGIPMINKVSHFKLIAGDQQFAMMAYRETKNILAFSMNGCESVDVGLSFSQCHYGGERPWFECPHCHRRVAQLAIFPWPLRCRHCHQKPYYSQQIDRLARLQRTKEKIGHQTFDNYPKNDWQKPPRKHWRTFNKQVTAYEDATSAVNEALYTGLIRRKRY